MIDVVWLSLTDVQARGFWDQAIIEVLFDGTLYPPLAVKCRHSYSIDEVEGDGAVVVVPGGAHRDLGAELTAELARLRWCLVIVTGDEGSYFPPESLSHPNMALWVQTPRSDRHTAIQRPLPVGWTPHTRAALGMAEELATERPLDWAFAGQVTHDRRQQCFAALKGLSGGLLSDSGGFLQGMEQDAYCAMLASAKVAPCPAGIITPDSFRVWEALEAGCLPVVDPYAGEWDVPEYWRHWFDPTGEAPFPVVARWEELPQLMPRWLLRWPANANRAFAWWQRYKRNLAAAFVDDVTRLSEQVPEVASPDVTAIVTASPIPSNPSTDVLDATVASIRRRLHDAEIVLCFDGPRDDLSPERRAAYDEHKRRALWAANHQWRGVYPLLWDDHVHQAAMTKAALDVVRTPTVLFVEHDTPLVGDIEFGAIIRAVKRNTLYVVRFYPEDGIHPDHEHMMLDTRPRRVAGVPVRKTRQWSQRPHVASTRAYRKWLDLYFGAESCTFIEDVMHGVVDVHCREMGSTGWGAFRLAIYHPPGSIKRSTHLDGRADDPKAECYFAYDHKVPFGAPAPHGEREE